MALLPSQPIGVFDSGIGGLTVAHAIRQLLPKESMIYFGDTAHLPYGDKSEAAIQAYSVKIADILVRKGCKVIVIACNSASSAAYELLTEYVRKDIQIINVRLNCPFRANQPKMFPGKFVDYQFHHRIDHIYDLNILSYIFS